LRFRISNAGHRADCFYPILVYFDWSTKSSAEALIEIFGPLGFGEASAESGNRLWGFIRRP
jgi:hypothetical protein